MTPLPRNEPATFNDHFEARALRVPDRTAFRLKIPGGYTSVSYREAHAEARSAAHGLLALGLEPLSRVAILSENRPEWATYPGLSLRDGRGPPTPRSARVWPADPRLRFAVIFVSGG